MPVAMTPKQWFNYEWRLEVFLKKYENKEPFTLTNGKEVIFEYSDEIVKFVKSSIKTKNKQILQKIKLYDSDLNSYTMSKIAKTTEFGGKGEGFSTRQEKFELKRLRDQLNKIKKEQRNSTVSIQIDGKTYEVSDVENTPGTPKSDIHLIDINGKEIVWISLKKGKTPKNILQWGGISEREEPKINRHPEVQSFIEKLKKTFPNGFPEAKAYYRKIKDKKLKMMSVYGNEYGSSYSRQNCTIIIQGPVYLKKIGSNYIFESNHIYFNGDDIEGEFEPVLQVRRGDRKDAGVPNARIGISSIGGRRMDGEI